MLGSEGLRSAGATPAARGTAAFRGVSSTRRLVCRHELVFAIANQVGTPHMAQRLTQHGPVIGIVVAQERLV